MTFIAPRSGAVKHGGPKDDTPLGWSGPDSLFGGAGDDVLWGNHAIEDSTARDILFGGLGDDTVFCSPGSNVISGGPGDDVLNGGAGRSRVTGGPGNDTLNTRGAGPHTVDAGPGSDIICGRCAIEAIEVRIPAQARAAGGGDGHMTIVDQSSGWEYDLWRVQTKPSGGGRLAFAWGGRTRIDGDGLGSDATAARLGNLAGAIRAQELTAGRIDHALFMVVRYDSGGHVNPAMKSGRACADRAGAPPMGARFQLDMSTLQINALPCRCGRRRSCTRWPTTAVRRGHRRQRLGSAVRIRQHVHVVRDRGPARGLRWCPGGSDLPRTAGLQHPLRVDWAAALRMLDPCTARAAC